MNPLNLINLINKIHRLRLIGVTNRVGACYVWYDATLAL